MDRVKILKLITSILICLGAGFIGSIFTSFSISTWYVGLQKPSFNPPNWIFAPVWTFLFLLMGISLYLVWSKNWEVKAGFEKEKRKTWNPISEKLWTGFWKEENVVAIFALQLILNILWSVIFFGLKSPSVAFVEILMLWFSILYMIVNFYRISKTASFLLIPYILWVTFATILNLSIAIIN